MLAKLTSKNQLTLPKSVTDKLGPVQYFEVQLQAGQVLLTPVRIQRGDAVRAKLAELDLGEDLVAKAMTFASKGAEPAASARKRPVKTVAVKAGTAKPTAKATTKAKATAKSVARTAPAKRTTAKVAKTSKTKTA